MEVLRDLASLAGVELRRAAAHPGGAQGPPARPSPNAIACSARWSWRLPSSRSSTPARPAPPRAPTSRGVGSGTRSEPVSASATRRAAGMGCRRTSRRSRSRSSVDGAAGSGGRQRARTLRLLPRPRDAAGARPTEARDRVRRTPARSRRQGPQVRQLARTRPSIHKKEQLYGLHAALDPIRRSGTAIVVEGNFDVLALHEAGIDNAVAPMGTALTNEQVATLGKLARTVTVVFDGDTAGQRASAKAIPLFVDEDVDGRIARLPTGIDPDDFVRRSEDGPAAFRRLVDGARPMVDQFIDDLASGRQRCPTGWRRSNRSRPLLVRVRNRPRVSSTSGGWPASSRCSRLRFDAPCKRPALPNGPERLSPAGRLSRPRRRRRPASPPAAPSAPGPARSWRPWPSWSRNPELLRLPEAARAGDLLLHPVVAAAPSRRHRAGPSDGRARRAELAGCRGADRPDCRFGGRERDDDGRRSGRRGRSRRPCVASSPSGLSCRAWRPRSI